MPGDGCRNLPQGWDEDFEDRATLGVEVNLSGDKLLAVHQENRRPQETGIQLGVEEIRFGILVLLTGKVLDHIPHAKTQGQCAQLPTPINDRLLHKDPDWPHPGCFFGTDGMQNKNAIPGQFDHIVLAAIFVHVDQAVQAVYDIAHTDSGPFIEAFDTHDQPGMPWAARVGIDPARASGLDQDELRHRHAFGAAGCSPHPPIAEHLTFRHKLLGDCQTVSIKVQVLDQIVGHREHQVIKINGEIVVSAAIEPRFKHEQCIGPHMPDAQAIDRVFEVGGKQQRDRGKGRVRIVQVGSAWRNRPALVCGVNDGKRRIASGAWRLVIVRVQRTVRHEALSWLENTHKRCVGAR
ncbi:hypothetical protein PFLU3_57220 [Pseudomonas fluorescens]|uniref:Uncharacterized protein n=1 Tax=Pseudomonas fluorescens TaxID=294 RepID=A0A0D0SXM8_PSEFL|nr:hypothetical protein PFLU3_57220 [Pseudomonas fluorescens]